MDVFRAIRRPIYEYQYILIIDTFQSFIRSERAEQGDVRPAPRVSFSTACQVLWAHLRRTAGDAVLRQIQGWVEDDNEIHRIPIWKGLPHASSSGQSQPKSTVW